MELPIDIKNLINGPVALFGSGVSGRAVMDILRHHSISFLSFDERGEENDRHFFNASDAREHALVIYSPGFSQDHAWLQIARGEGCLCLGEIDFASLFWKGRIITVTGTNGKTTLAEFLSFALKRQGTDAMAVGNNGFPFSRLYDLENTERKVAVCEVSSFQAESLQYFKSDALIWTNFTEDHLDRYQNIKNYFSAKWNLVKSLRHPSFIAGESVAKAAEKFGYLMPDYVKIVTETEETPWSLPYGSVFTTYPQRNNLQLALSFWQSESFLENKLRDAVLRFPPRRHRLEKVIEIGEISFWNDSKATNFAATFAALKEFDEPVIWIGGGQSKGGDINKFAREVAGKVKMAYLIGETAEEIAKGFKDLNKTVEGCETMQDAVFSAFEKAEPKNIVLLSPGFSSLDMFENYDQRGSSFENAVMSLKSHLIQNKI